ncbi:MAG: HD domain-containing protein, partial [Candidatus Promineifilaceae bacterium]
MSASDQQHALRVYRLLRAIGQTDKKLLCAALLHDVGKISTKLTVWDRSLAVLG